MLGKIRKQMDGSVEAKTHYWQLCFQITSLQSGPRARRYKNGVTWMSHEVSKRLGSVAYIPNIFDVEVGYNPLILTIDPNFLGHPSKTYNPYEWPYESMELFHLVFRGPPCRYIPIY